jgi:hypothetical protein
MRELRPLVMASVRPEKDMVVDNGECQLDLNISNALNQCCGSMTFWCGSGLRSESWIRIRIRILDPDPAIFVIDLQDANKKLI